MAKTFPGTILLPTTKINVILEGFIVSEKIPRVLTWKEVSTAGKVCKVALVPKYHVMRNMRVEGTVLHFLTLVLDGSE
jgi:hypothetical protein